MSTRQRSDIRSGITREDRIAAIAIAALLLFIVAVTIAGVVR